MARHASAGFAAAVGIGAGIRGGGGKAVSCRYLPCNPPRAGLPCAAAGRGDLEEGFPAAWSSATGMVSTRPWGEARIWKMPWHLGHLMFVFGRMSLLVFVEYPQCGHCNDVNTAMACFPEFRSW